MPTRWDSARSLASGRCSKLLRIVVRPCSVESKASVSPVASVAGCAVGSVGSACGVCSVAGACAVRGASWACTDVANSTCMNNDSTVAPAIGATPPRRAPRARGSPTRDVISDSRGAGPVDSMGGSPLLGIRCLRSNNREQPGKWRGAKQPGQAPALTLLFDPAHGLTRRQCTHNDGWRGVMGARAVPRGFPPGVAGRHFGASRYRCSVNSGEQRSVHRRQHGCKKPSPDILNTCRANRCLLWKQESDLQPVA